MTDQLTIAIPAFDAITPEEIQAFAAQNLDLMRQEAQSVSTLTEQAYQRAWAVGKACVHLKDNGIIQADLWEDWAKQNIGGGDYLPVYRCMREFRKSPTRPPGRPSAQFKQLQIMLGDEPMPKTTPRKSDVVKFANFKASCAAIQRWWRSGDVIAGFDAETLKEIEDDLTPLVAIAQAVRTARLNLEGEE